MNFHDIETLQKNLHRVTQQVDAVANFKMHLDKLRQIFNCEFNAKSALYKEARKLSGNNPVSSFFSSSQSFLETVWTDNTPTAEILARLDRIRELNISMKGLVTPSSEDWGVNHFDAKLTFAFGDSQYSARATCSVDSQDPSRTRIGVTYVEFNYRSIIKIAEELGVETQPELCPIEGNPLVIAAFKATERMFEQYLLMLNFIDCSSSEEIRFNLAILDEIELKDAVDSLSMDTLSATSTRQIKTIESKLISEVDDLTESIIGSSSLVSRDLVCDLIEKVVR